VSARRGAVLAALLAALAAGPAAAEVRVIDDRGTPVSLPAPPRRIVTLVPSLTETVCELGACDRLVGTDRHSNWPLAPVDVRALPKVGGMDDAQVERIVALRPDLVLATPSTRAVARLEGLGLTVAVLEARSADEARRMVATVATLLGRPEQGAVLWSRLDRQVQRAVQRVPASMRGRTVYFEVDSAPYAAGQASFIGELMARFGLVNIVPAALGPFPKLNPEHVVRAQPQVILAAQRHLAELAGRPGWSSIPAVRQRQTCGFAPDRYDTLVRPGPRLGEAADLLADCLTALAGDGAR
jgi:iron complex transport system substrate-binding protein